MDDGKSTISQEKTSLPKGVRRCAVAASEVYLLVDRQFDATSAQIVAGDISFPFVESTSPASAVFRQNLIPEADFTAEIPLIPPADVKVRIGKDILPEWTIAVGHTAYIEVPEQQDAPFECFVDFGEGRGQSFELEPDVSHVFEATGSRFKTRCHRFAPCIMEILGGRMRTLIPMAAGVLALSPFAKGALRERGGGQCLKPTR
jgi:hypothetical protein